jgi:hypothetical protein
MIKNTSGIPAQSSESIAAHIRMLEIKRTQALVAKDMVVARAMHAPEYQLITPAGKTFTRESYLHAIESGELNYAKWEAGPMQVRATEQMAVVRYQANLEFASGNSVRCWHTDMYELLDGEWRAVWSQATATPAQNQNNKTAPT